MSTLVIRQLSISDEKKKQEMRKSENQTVFRLAKENCTVPYLTEIIEKWKKWKVFLEPLDHQIKRFSVQLKRPVLKLK